MASEQQMVVVASFPSRRAAEHMLSSLGREFRRTARKGHVSAFVVSENSDKSMNLRQSHVVTASELSAVLIHLSLSWTVGFMGIVSGIKGVRGSVHAVHEHKGHVGADEHPAHAILAKAGSHGAAALVTCQDETMSQKVNDGAAKSAVEHWNGSLPEFLDQLEPSPKDDWVRHALGVPASSATG
jgi:hypothetical protein